MNQDKQPEALRLAYELNKHRDTFSIVSLADKAAAELRSQHALIAELEAELAALKAAPAAAAVEPCEYPPLPMSTACHAIDGVSACWGSDEMRAYVNADRALRATPAASAAPQAQDVQDALPEGLVEWLGNGSRGISSNSIVEHLTGINCTGDWGMDHPHDPDDLDRCLRLLEAVPSLRNQLPRMSTASKEWAGLIMRWSEIEASHLEEVGLGWTKASRAPKTYELMRAAIAASAKGGE